MKDHDYAYAVARIRANEGRLLTEAQVRTLAETPSFDAAVQMLQSLGWLEDKALTDVSAIIASQYDRLWQLLKESLPDLAQCRVLTLLNDFQNLKTALKCMLTGADPARLYITPTSLDLAALTTRVQTHAFDLLDPPFAAPAKSAYEAACRTESGQSADVIVDAAALQALSDAAGATGSRLLTDVFDFICDSTNMKIAYRCARTGKDISFTEDAVSACAKLDHRLLCAAAVRGEDALLAYLAKTPYADGAALLKASTSAFEKWCDDSVTQMVKRAKYVFFGFDPVVAYYYAKVAEIKSVRMILSGKQGGVPSETIEERLRALYV
ncbi:MAG: V-type ATPase subunit [Clostridia bacterium]|nr:V-type ATPase subunit [Clostridia bacterium]MBR3552842.1 V-type ATPase subunit [Clostridia bacterium]